MAIDDLSWICNWYLSQCDDDWEHSFGVTIRNLDNPGWMVEINLDGTELEEKIFKKSNLVRGHVIWKNGVLPAVGGLSP